MTDKIDPLGAMETLDGRLMKATEIYEGTGVRSPDGEYLGDDYVGQWQRDGMIYAVASVLHALEGMGYSDRHQKTLIGLLGALSDVKEGQIPDAFKNDSKTGARRKPNILIARQVSAACLALVYEKQGDDLEAAAAKVSLLLSDNVKHPGKGQTGGARAIINFIKHLKHETRDPLTKKYYAAGKAIIDSNDTETAEMIFRYDIRRGV